ncbi:hypothetical protein LCGC14_2134830 [marine sediment metagenome]|uniref:Uncharacterized protein n=1 Tax=marine sediment metagenome TaxID=412755 RepID=A0A0F9E0D9_9ZZZZ
MTREEELRAIEEAEERLKQQRQAVKNRITRLKAHQSKKLWYK